MISRFLLALFAATLLSGCAAPALTIVQDKQFDMMNRHMHRELEKRGLLNAGHGFSLPFFGVQAVIGSFETSENTYTDVIPISIGGTPPLTDPLQERVIAGVTILLENTENPEKVNELLHEYASGIIGRMGLPYREAGINLITLNLDAPIHQVLALTDRLSKLRGAHVKTTYIAKEDRHE